MIRILNHTFLEIPYIVHYTDFNPGLYKPTYYILYCVDLTIFIFYIHVNIFGILYIYFF